MSYEGYVQMLCERGHYEIKNAHDNKNDNCYACGAPFIWFNNVDDTNIDNHGFIEMKQFLMNPAITETCTHCKHVKEVAAEVYRVPTDEEVKKSRTYWDGTAKIDRYIWNNKPVKTDKEKQV